MTEDLSETIRKNAEGPASASGDGTSIQQHSLRQLIDSDKHLARKAAGRNPMKALTRVKIVPPGAA